MFCCFLDILCHNRVFTIISGYCVYVCCIILQLLDHETKAANQIPLLMKIEKYDTALKKAIDSGDSNLGQYQHLIGWIELTSFFVLDLVTSSKF